MAAVALTGKDTLIINNRSLSDLADADVATLEFPTEIASLKTGKNGNSIYSLNETGRQADLKIKLIRGSADDKFMQNLLTQQQANFSGFILMTGTFIKNIGDGKGNVLKDTYELSGGIFTKQIMAKSNVEGDAAQSTSEYMLKFSNAPRVIT